MASFFIFMQTYLIMITSKIIANGILRALGILVIIGLSLYFLYTIQTVLFYLIGALVFSLICNPIVELLKKIKFNNFWAVVTTLLLFIVLLILFSLLFVPLISTQVQSLSLLNRDEIQQNFGVIYSDFLLYLNQHHIALESVFKDLDVASSLNFNFVPAILNHFFSTLSSIGIGIATVFFITFFILKDKNIFWTSFQKIIPNKFEDEILNSIQKIYHLLSRYFIGLLLQLFIVFILYFIVLAVFDVKNALIIAFLCAILNIIPYVGPLIGTFLAATLTLIGGIGSDFQTEMLPTTIYVVIGFFIVQIIDNNVNQPLIFSNSTKSHPLEIFLVILIAGFISGITGMIIAVPFYTIIKVLAKEFFPNNKIVKVITRKI